MLVSARGSTGGEVDDYPIKPVGNPVHQESQSFRLKKFDWIARCVTGRKNPNARFIKMVNVSNLVLVSAQPELHIYPVASGSRTYVTKMWRRKSPSTNNTLASEE